MVLFKRFGVSVPRIWGKLPAHADYVSFNASSTEAYAWRLWCQANIKELEVSHLATNTEDCHKQTSYILNEVFRYLPVSFILPPGTLPFSKRRYVFGVLCWSYDKVGRKHPLIVYQTASGWWLRHFWLLQTPTLTQPNEDWLFRIRQIIFDVAVRPMLTERVHNPANQIQQIANRITQLWFNEIKPSVQSTSFAHDDGADSPCTSSVQPIMAGIEALEGVGQLPFADWPTAYFARRGKAAVSAFWQQDHKGRYVNASFRLNELWQ